MYHDEIFIDGWIHWRGTPGGAWTRGTLEEQTAALHNLYYAGLKDAAARVTRVAENVKCFDYKQGVRDARAAINEAISNPNLHIHELRSKE